MGPQIIVTEPDGNQHYLVDPETYWAKHRQRSEQLLNECRGGREQVLTETTSQSFDEQEFGNEEFLELLQSIVISSDRGTSSLRGGRIIRKWKKWGSKVMLPMYRARICNTA